MGSQKIIINPLKLTNKKILIFIAIIIMLIVIFYKLNYGDSIESIKNSVVKIEVYDNDNQLIATGSGFSAYKSNWIVTNYHVIEGANSIYVITDEKEEYTVNDIIIFHKENDLAILSINGNLKNLKLGNGNRLKVKDKVTAIGSPMGELNTVSEGIISNVDEEDEIRITTPISHGSSGGILLNNKNEVIGITSAGYDNAQNLNFAININTLKEMYSAYKTEDYKLINTNAQEFCTTYIETLEFKFCVGGSVNDYYKPSNLNIFYKITNYETRYSYLLENSSWETIYNSISDKDKKLIISYYKEFEETNYCENECNVSSNIKTWDVNEFMINLNILSKMELALVLVDLENYVSDDDKFYRVEDYPLEAAEKSLILYLIGNRSWNNIHKDNKEDIFDYFDSEYNTQDLSAILRILGYTVVLNDDGTLTAYW